MHKMTNFPPRRSVSSLCKAWWPTAVVAAVILYGTWLPADAGPANLPAIPDIDKWIHAIFGGGLFSAMLFDHTRLTRRAPILTAIVAFALIAMAAMALDEAIQGILPIARPSDPFDLLADWGGILIAALAAPRAISAVTHTYQ